MSLLHLPGRLELSSSILYFSAHSETVNCSGRDREVFKHRRSKFFVFAFERKRALDIPPLLLCFLLFPPPLSCLMLPLQFSDEFK
jgi:hypothetical protein